MKLASHNSWTFGSLHNWWLPKFMAKCQNKNIQQQYDAGVRLFDLRLKFYKGKFVVAHGIYKYKVDWEEDLKWLNQKPEQCYVRVLLEYNKLPRCISAISNYFFATCHHLEFTYRNIRFFGGNLKCDSYPLYDFNFTSPPLIGAYSSATSLFRSKNKLLAKIDDLWPWLYAKCYNTKNKTMYKNNTEYILMDFV